MSENEKLSAILKGVQTLQLEQAKYLVHQEQHRKELNDLQKSTENLKDNQNKAIGFLSVGGLGATALFNWLFRSL